MGQDGALIADGLRLPGQIGEGGFWRAAERVIEGIAGRYVVLISDGCATRLYFDPVCDMAAVFDPRMRVVASSLLLCLHRPLRRNRRMPHEGPLKKRHNYALQQTPDRDATRAMPNHYLDLRSFCLARHYPRGDERFERGPEELEETCAAIVARLRQVMAALLGGHRCVIPVTGGNDSRNLLACCGAGLDRAEALFTFHMNKMTGFDCMIARRIGDRLGVPVRMIDVLAPAHAPLFEKERMHRMRWDVAYATGYQTSGSSPGAVRPATLAPGGDVLVRGNVMELMRANQYPPGMWDGFSLAHGLDKLRVAPRIDAAQEAAWGPDYMMWADTLPANARRRIYDFAFCEQLLPNTMGGVLIAPAPQFYMNAFADRGMMALALSMHPAARRANRMNRMLVDLACPGLNEIDRANAFKREAGNHAAYDREFGHG